MRRLQGLSLTETVVVVTVLLLVVQLVMNLVVSSYISISTGEQNLTAAQLAQSWLEQARTTPVTTLPDRTFQNVTYHSKLDVQPVPGNARLTSMRVEVSWDTPRGPKTVVRRCLVCKVAR